MHTGMIGLWGNRNIGIMPLYSRVKSCRKKVLELFHGFGLAIDSGDRRMIEYVNGQNLSLRHVLSCSYLLYPMGWCEVVQNPLAPSYDRTNALST